MLLTYLELNYETVTLRIDIRLLLSVIWKKFYCETTDRRKRWSFYWSQHEFSAGMLFTGYTNTRV